MAGRLGDRAVLASRLGADDLGTKARKALNGLPVDASLVQTDAALGTGTVTVALSGGEPQYTIHAPVAWDRLEFTREWAALAESADAVCFGTLAQRDPAAGRTIIEFLDATRPGCVRVFDANLRAPFWSGDTLRESLARATILKLNAGELPLVLLGTGAGSHPSSTDDEDGLLRGVRLLLERYPIKLVCVTLGAVGSLLATREAFHRHPGLTTTVKDTVGAGDAFTAALTHYYLRGAPLAVLNDAGNRWGAWMASQTGAMPPLNAATAARMAEEIAAGAGSQGQPAGGSGPLAGDR
jgi:fructokinase